MDEESGAFVRPIDEFNEANKLIFKMAQIGMQEKNT